MAYSPRFQDYRMNGMEQQMLKELVARELPNFSPTIDDARVVVGGQGGWNWATI